LYVVSSMEKAIEICPQMKRIHHRWRWNLYLGILFKKLNYARPSHFEADAFFPEIILGLGNDTFWIPKDDETSIWLHLSNVHRK
jgi:hypothetical protein